ncbi:MAG: hypothetical protein ACJ79W_15205 [Myxococcales bacterium]
MRTTTILLALAMTAGAALADPIAEEAVQAQTPPPSTIGVSVGLGGGVTDFTGNEMSNAASPGGAWEVRGTIGTRKLIAVEAAYVGSRRNIDVLGVSGTDGETAHIFSNGLEGALRLQYPYLAGKWMFQPFVFGGLGWTHMGVDGTLTPTSPIRDSDDLLVVPMGGGLSATWNRIVLEARFTYRATYNEDLLVNSDGSKASLSNWSTGALIGYEF